MIAVDTSALMAIALREPAAESCLTMLAQEQAVLISAGTLAETLIVAGRRGVSRPVAGLVEQLAFQVIPVTAAIAARVANAYDRWGRGMHAAGLNFGDCFAYVTAKDEPCPLLYVGNDFRLTDIQAAIPLP